MTTKKRLTKNEKPQITFKIAGLPDSHPAQKDFNAYMQKRRGNPDLHATAEGACKIMREATDGKD